MSTHNLCFEQKYEKYQNFLSEKFHFLVAKLSVYLYRHVFVMTFMGSVQNISWAQIWVTKKAKFLHADNKL